jgi:hypothetical protein
MKEAVVISCKISWYLRVIKRLKKPTQTYEYPAENPTEDRLNAKQVW